MIAHKIEQYLNQIAEKYSRQDEGVAKNREMIYRTDFENLLKEIFEADGKVIQINHDATFDKGNKPDFVVAKNAIPVLYIEAKDLGVNLDKIEKSDQLNRYFGYENLILTDYVEFRFFRRGQKYGESILLAEIGTKSRSLKFLPQNFEYLIKTIQDFCVSNKEPIKSGLHLAKIMGAKARRIKDNVSEMLLSKTQNEALSSIEEVIKQNLISNLTDDAFADMYAQTLVYGLFAARFSDVTRDTFTRSEARDLITNSNPFLREFFDHIAGVNFPERLKYIVDELCEVLTYADIQKLLHDHYGKSSKDPVIHFYEDFLREYDSKKKMDLGVFYTPQPVVSFIIKAVDQILKTEFGLSKGLLDDSKVLAKAKIQPIKGKKDVAEKEFFKVQILDIATGTGTFLNEVINFAFEQFKNGQQGLWPQFALQNLLPRLHGFELMVASYTIAHIKLKMSLNETGVNLGSQRLGIYLTNSLEEAGDYSNQLPLPGIVGAITKESQKASEIKSEYPIMCVIGNPPYAVGSNNKGEFITKLIEDYKVRLNEKNIQPLSDDYIKFIRLSQNLIDKNGSGIMAMITNNSFVDGIIHRQMRKKLLESFDKIYILNLHGNARKKEVSPNGSKDQNVFDIMQGVSINIFVKNNKKQNNLGQVYYADIFGDRKSKYNFLETNSLSSVDWQTLNYAEPNYFFVPKDFGLQEEYENGFKLNELFELNAAGLASHKDGLLMQFSEEEIDKVKQDFKELSKTEFLYKYQLTENEDWQYESAKKDLGNANLTKINFRPFDVRYTFYSGKTKGLMARPRYEIMQHLLKDNLALITIKRQTTPNWNHVMVSNYISEKGCISLQTSETNFVMPLYLYSGEIKTPNLNKQIWSQINNVAGEASPEQIVYYIYAYLHSPRYRQKYVEFLKIDFPRVPYPKTADQFLAIAKIGEQLVNLHLMKSQDSQKIITTFSVAGTGLVEKIKFEENKDNSDFGKVWINSEQYFGDVPLVAWEMFIGGYQPAQKWLKDRKGRELTFDEISHYQKIISVLTQTREIMKGID